MGTPLEPNPPGELCIVCWGPSKPFGETTPLFMQIQLSNLQQGEFWNPADGQLLLTPHFLQQDPARPCIFTINDGTFFWDLNYRSGGTTFDIERNSDGELAFLLLDGDICSLDFDDENTDPFGVVAHSGRAILQEGGGPGV